MTAHSTKICACCFYPTQYIWILLYISLEKTAFNKFTWRTSSNTNKSCHWRVMDLLSNPWFPLTYRRCEGWCQCLVTRWIVDKVTRIKQQQYNIQGWAAGGRAQEGEQKIWTAHFFHESVPKYFFCCIFVFCRVFFGGGEGGCIIDCTLV